MPKPKRKRPWWKWWGSSRIKEPPKAIAYHPEAKETGTTRTK
jgi:hypothetical protein